MTPAAGGLASLAGHLDDLADRLQPALAAEAGAADLRAIREFLSDLSEEARRRARVGLGRALARVGVLTELWECRAGEPGDAAGEIGLFCIRALARLAREEAGGGDGEAVAAWVLDQSSSNWGDYLGLLEGDAASPAGEADPLAEPEAEFVGPEPDEPPAIDAQALLRLFGVATATAPETHREGGPPAEPAPPPPRPILDRGPGRFGASGTYEPPRGTDRQGPPGPAGASPSRCGSASPVGKARLPEKDAQAIVIPPLPRGIDLDDEIREAFLADATDLFERIESLVLDVGRGAGSPDSLRELGRCFHTLKGASGSVGLTDLAALVHELEEHLESARGPLPPGLIDALHQILVYLEGILGLLRGGEAPAPATENAATAAEPPSEIHAAAVVPTAAAAGGSPSGDGQEGPIRLASGRLDELMDVASELIARRRSWMSQAESLKAVAAMARGLRGRMHACLDRLHEAGLGREEGTPGAVGPRGSRVDVPGQLLKLGELDDDLAVMADTAMAAAAPLADHGDALGRLTMQLWDELQSIRIVPVRGLFQRLARVAIDAARVEGRRVDVVMAGEQMGLDRAVQDRAYEPLLHVVRNAVGHGVEPPDERARAGKPAAGRITLEARREGNSLAISVQDDGRGLDHAAIEAKAQRLGLIPPGEAATAERLNELIFHSGFSTRDAANAISGRGVGMDVVAREVGLLRGTIELRTERGRGTRMTVRLPARLALETVMLARVDGQAFAIPVAQIEHAQPVEPGELGGARFPFRDAEIPLADARAVLGVADTPAPAWPKLLVVRSAGGPVALVVDAIEGTEELVIRPLNALLAGHPLISGTSVSASGEVISVLNLAGLHAEANAGPAEPGPGPDGRAPAKGAGCSVLVVDDSISVRRVMARQLRALGLAVDEVSDGQEALGRLRDGSYGLVVTDLEMPRLDGLGLLAEMRRLPPLAATPVIVASTKADAETRQRARSLGAGAFLPKPVDPAALAQAVGGLVPPAARAAGLEGVRTAEEPWKAR
ncbi:Chemotaxis protein CheA [Aquisphaera giovannonii]|uniref:histidine kinase n=1 Tax=Aquisphaera giovannonii TaxID=406548 RepID=A0A5B9WE66_9BACT|nr:response regulator [Aquisphaera giovannonii]QEH38261.1 Chemotaxis protein CheA [Aquisphaera giovannonii]